jgi:hypothetical protein
MNAVDKEIETHTTYGFYAAKHAAMDVAARSQEARELHEDFFADAAHTVSYTHLRAHETG